MTSGTGVEHDCQVPQRTDVPTARLFPDREIVVTLSHKLNWSHILALLPLRNDAARAFYAREAAAGRWSVRELRHAISRKAYERREIADSQLGPGSMVPADTFSDPYLLDFLLLFSYPMSQPQDGGSDRLPRQFDRLLELSHPISLILGVCPDVKLPAGRRRDISTREQVRMKRLPAVGDTLHRTEMNPTDRYPHRWHFDDLEPCKRFAVVYVPGRDLHTFFHRFVQRHRGIQRAGNIADDLGNVVEHRHEGRFDLGLIGNDSGASCETQRGQRLFDEFNRGHLVLRFNEVEPSLHVNECCGSDPVLTLDLGPTDTQQLGKEAGIDPLREHGCDVLDTETQTAQRDDPMHPLELGRIIGAVTVELVHMRRYEQTDRVPMA